MLWQGFHAWRSHTERHAHVLEGLGDMDRIVSHALLAWTAHAERAHSAQVASLLEQRDLYARASLKALPQNEQDELLFWAEAQQVLALLSHESNRLCEAATDVCCHQATLTLCAECAHWYAIVLLHARRVGVLRCIGPRCHRRCESSRSCRS